MDNTSYIYTSSYYTPRNKCIDTFLSTLHMHMHSRETKVQDTQVRVRKYERIKGPGKTKGTPCCRQQQPSKL